MSPSAFDHACMRKALQLARRRLGQTAPNPAVGCVIAKAGRIVGEAATAAAGRPHAEPLALAQAGGEALGADVYVTLEPCSHHGATPPCVEALIAAGIGRCVIAVLDSNPKVDGRGASRLKAAGVTVEIGLQAEAAARINAGFFHRMRTGRPLVAISREGLGFEAELTLQPGESLEAALARYGKAGFNRIWARLGTMEAKAVRAARAARKLSGAG